MQHRITLLAGFLLMVAGCGAPDAPSGPTGAPPAPESTTAAPSTTQTGSVAPAPEALPVPPPEPPSKTPLPPASNGSDLAACKTGRCEVVVAAKDKISLPDSLGVGALVVEGIAGRRLTLASSGPGDVVTLDEQEPGMTSTMKQLAVTTVAVNDDKAVIRLAPA